MPIDTKQSAIRNPGHPLGAAIVLLLCEHPSLNGGERSLLATVGPLRRAGFELVAAAPPVGEMATALRKINIQLFPLVLYDRAGKLLPLEERRRELRLLLEAARPNLLHANSLAMSRLSGPVAAQLQLPSLGHVRDIVRLSRAAVADVNRHTRILCVSQAALNWHVVAGLDQSKAHVLHNGVDLQEFRPRPASGALHAELGLSSETALVGTIGQTGPRKGMDVFLSAAAVVARQHPQSHFLIIGRRYSQKRESLEYERSLHQAARQDPLRGRCHFLGVRNDVPRILNELTALVHAARQEPLGRVLLESAASGLPVAATDVGGTCEIFPTQANAALLKPSDDAAGLADAMGTLLADESLRRQLGAAARRIAERTFDAQLAGRNLAAHYRAVWQGAARKTFLSGRII